MKSFLVLFALVVAASSAAVKPVGVSGELAQIQEIVDAINHPSTDPATAAALEQMLFDVLGVSSPVAIDVQPVIVDTLEPTIVASPALVDFPVPDGGALTAPVADVAPVVASPVAAVEATPAQASSPLVQLILNINTNAPAAAAAVQSPVAVVAPEAVVEAYPVSVVEVAAPEPVSVVEVAPEAVSVVQVAPEVVSVVEAAPEAVIVAQPVAVAPAVTLPEVLN